jgi:hypothetical protein
MPIDPFKELRNMKEKLKYHATEYVLLSKFRLKYTGYGYWGIYEYKSNWSYNKETNEFEHEC